LIEFDDRRLSTASDGTIGDFDDQDDRSVDEKVMI
jgi:hypothetical protein